MREKIVISGGGTGGHLAIAKSLMLECQKQGVSCLYIGSTSGQDRFWFENEKGFESVHFLQTSGVVNKRGLSIFKSIYAQIKAFFKARKILKSHAVSCVFSVGGYSSAPASFAALSLRLPLFVHEQNATKGILNQILSPFARKVFGSFQDGNLKTSKADMNSTEGTSSQKYASFGANFLLTSYPVRDEFFDRSRIREEIKSILFLGGSQGAVAINDFALQIAPILHQRGIHIMHQCGEKDYERLRCEYMRLGIEVELFSFSLDLASLMGRADLCFTRAGASSVWETCANMLPCVYIPYPYASNHHQEHNASFFTKEGLGVLCLQENLGEDLLERVFKLDLALISRGLSAKIQRGGAGEIFKHILNGVRNG